MSRCSFFSRVVAVVVMSFEGLFCVMPSEILGQPLHPPGNEPGGSGGPPGGTGTCFGGTFSEGLSRLRNC